MQFSISRSALLGPTSLAHSLVERRPAVPVLSHLLIEAAEGVLLLRATDLDHTLTARLPASITAPGRAIVLVQTLYDALRKSENVESLSFSLSEGGERMNLKAGRSRFSLAVLQGVDFPPEEAFSAAAAFSFSAKDLKKLIGKTRFSISTEETRYALNGVYFHTAEGGDRLHTAATDSHRLSATFVPFAAPTPLSMILSRKTIGELWKFLERHEENIAVSTSASQIRFDFGDKILTARIIDGKFPDYVHVIPERSETFFCVDRRKFIESVDRVSIITDEMVRVVKLKLQESLLRVFSERHGLGAAEDDIDVSCSQSDAPWEGGFNARYLLDAAENAEGDVMKIFVKDAMSPILIEPSEDPSTSFVIMPMRV